MRLAASTEAEGKGEPVATGAPRPGTPPPEPAELAPLFPELEIGALLGAGGMGAVYRAKKKRLGRDVALKVLHAELSGDPVWVERSVFAERFLREAQAMARLAHPGIVAVHDYGEREGRCFLVMELVEGTNLRALLKQGLLAPRQALDIVRQLCDALQFAHDEGVVHRDIKPENVLVDAKGRVKVADFGLAKLVGAPASVTLTDAGQVMGTPHYMAPEQVERPRDVDHRADLFSLGVVFYEMLTGELPLGRFSPPSQRVQVDVRLDEIVLKTLERERERRYQQAAQVKTDVERVEREPAPRHGHRQRLRLRSGVYLPRPEVLFGRHRPTAWGWAALFTIAWIACGASFNLGATWFWLVSVPLLTWLFLSVVPARAGIEPALTEEAASVHFSINASILGHWVSRLSPAAFGVAALGIATLLVAHVAVWERWTWNYVSSEQAPMAGLLRWQGAEDELLRHADPERDPTAARAAELRLEPVSSHWLDSPHALLGLHPLLLCSLAGMLLFAGGWITVRRLPARVWRAAVFSSMALLLAPVAALDVLTLAVGGRGSELVPVQAALDCPGGEAGALGQALCGALLERELEVHAEHDARIVAGSSGDELARVHVLAAAPASIFARWRMTWTGPRRTEPHVLFTAVSSATSKRAAILADGGRVDRDQLASNEWMSRMRSTLRVACDAPGEK
jgi:hypothetical protein